jgi:CBS domain-containing protein
MNPVSELLKYRGAPLWHVRPDETVYAALELLAQREVGALVVMQQGRLVGIVSERDYTRKVALQGRSSRATLVSEIMTREVVTVRPQASVLECMALMSERKIRHLPVVDGATVLGMISIRDLMDEIIDEQRETIEQLERYIHS